MSDHATLVAAAERAVAAACRVTRSVQQTLIGADELTKDDRSPVTVADFAAQAVVHHKLAERIGTVRIVGEENAAALRGDDHREIRNRVVEHVRTVWPEATEDAVLDAIDACDHDASAESYWTLDPVDGTKGFLRGGQYAISLALIENGDVTIGVMGCPNLSANHAQDFNEPDPVGLIYSATKGGGTHECAVDDLTGARQRIRLEGGSGARIRVCESVESGHTKHDDTARIVAKLGGAGAPARLDSQCKYAVVARDQADAYLRLPTRPGYVERIWDHAAGMLVATEAGAVVTDIEGKPLDFSCGAGLEKNRGVICASRAFHSRIISAIRDLQITPAAR